MRRYIPIAHAKTHTVSIRAPDGQCHISRGVLVYGGCIDILLLLHMYCMPVYNYVLLS